MICCLILKTGVITAERTIMDTREHLERIAALDNEERRLRGAETEAYNKDGNVEAAQAALEEFYRRKNEYARELMKDIIDGKFTGTEYSIEYQQEDNFYYDKIRIEFDGETPAFTILPPVMAEMEKNMPENERLLYRFMKDSVDRTYSEFISDYEYYNYDVNVLGIEPKTIETDENGITWATYDESLEFGDEGSQPLYGDHKYILDNGFLYYDMEDYENGTKVGYTETQGDSYWNDISDGSPLEPLENSKRSLRDMLRSGIEVDENIFYAAEHYQTILPDSHPFKVTERVLNIRYQQFIENLEKNGFDRETDVQFNDSSAFPKISIYKNEDNTYTVEADDIDNVVLIKDGKEIELAREYYKEKLLDEQIRHIKDVFVISNSTPDEVMSHARMLTNNVFEYREIGAHNFERYNRGETNLYCKIDDKYLFSRTTSNLTYDEIHKNAIEIAEIINKNPVAAAILGADKDVKFDDINEFRKAAEQLTKVMQSGRDPELTRLNQGLEKLVNRGHMLSVYNEVLKDRGEEPLTQCYIDEYVQNGIKKISSVLNHMTTDDAIRYFLPTNYKNIKETVHEISDILSEIEKTPTGQQNLKDLSYVSNGNQYYEIALNLMSGQGQVENYIDKYKESINHEDLASNSFKRNGSISHQIELIVDDGMSPDKVKIMEELKIGYSSVGSHSFTTPSEQALDLIEAAPDKESVERLYNPDPDMTENQKLYLKETFCKTGDTGLINYMVEHADEWKDVKRDSAPLWRDEWVSDWYNKPTALMDQYQNEKTDLSATVENNGLSEFDDVAPEQDGGVPASDYEPGSLEFEEEASNAMAELKAEATEASKNGPDIEEQEYAGIAI